jgi:hypothetical protein
MKNVHKLSKMLGEPNVSNMTCLGKLSEGDTDYKRKYESLDRKMLTLRYHLNPLEYMLQHEFFEESSKEGIISIISVLTERQRIRKSTIRKTPAETPRSDQQSLISSFFVKNRPTKEKQTSQTQRREESDVEMTSGSDTSGDQSDRTV